MSESTILMTRRTFCTAGALGAAAVLGAGRSADAQLLGASVSAETEKANVRVVNEFCGQIHKGGDAAKAIALLADNCAYRVEQTRAPVTGRDAVAERVKSMIGRGLEFKTLKTVALGPIVLNERDDVFTAPIEIEGKKVGGFHVVAGMFFVQNGKIVEWTDYVVR